MLEHLKIACLVIAVASLPFLTGCDPTVDASSEENMQESVQAVKDSLPEDRQDEFEDAMQTLVFSDVEGLADLADSDGMLRRFRDKVDGKTGEEIIAAAEQVRQKQKERERQEAIAEIEELRDKLQNVHKDVLDDFVVERARFARNTDAFSYSDAEIELTVRNNTRHAVSRAYFHGMLVTPGRTIPWIDETFNYKIPGGLEPGQTATWRLSPNMFGEWGDAPTDRHDTVLIVRPVKLEGPNEQSLSGPRFDQDDEERLRALLEEVEYEGAEQVRQALAKRARNLKTWSQQAVVKAVKSEIRELRKKHEEAESSRASKARFVVERPRFYFRESSFRSKPVLDFTVRNGTEHVISRFSMRGVLSSPGREIPWVDDRFNYKVKGGLEPGEERHLKLAPNMFGDWGQAPEDRNDMVLTLDVLELEGANGEELFDADFSEQDEQRLSALVDMIRAAADRQSTSK